MFAALLPTTFATERRIQEVVEYQGRKQIGLYMARHAAPGATVGAECLGYLGYYSGRTVYDYPGLGSRKVVNWIKTQRHRRVNLNADMYAALRPDYILLRPREHEDWKGRLDFLHRDYRRERVFAVPTVERAKLYLAEFNQDLEFELWRRQDVPVQAAAADRPH